MTISNSGCRYEKNRLFTKNLSSQHGRGLHQRGLGCPPHSCGGSPESICAVAVTAEVFPSSRRPPQPARFPQAGHGRRCDRPGTQEKLKAIAPTLNIMVCRTQDKFRQKSWTRTIVYGDLSREEFLAASQLRWIQYAAAGVESILYPELVNSRVVLTNMQRMYSPTISESALVCS